VAVDVDVDVDVDFVIDASGPGGFLARQLGIPSGLERTDTRSALVFSHFEGVRPIRDVVPGLPDGPFPDEWAAVHHLIDEGWMYSLRFDDGVVSAGFSLTPPGLATLGVAEPVDAAALWGALLARYPTIGAAFARAAPTMPVRFQRLIQHRLTSAVGERWALLPHAYAFVDPLFSTGIAWSLRAVERLALLFENAERGAPDAGGLARYGAMLSAEADQIDRVVAGAYDAMAHFELFAAHAMLYFATVSFAEVRQRLVAEDGAAWSGFLGVGDPVLEPLAAESLARLRAIVGGQWGRLTGTAEERRRYAAWVAEAVAPRNVAGLADPARHDLYPVDLDVLIDRHALLGLTREEIVAALPALRGMAPEPSFAVPA
jgi:FADH2 O2-dependent halogenase